MKRTPLKQKTSLRKVSAKRKAQRELRGDALTPAQRNAEGQNCTLRLDGCRGDPAYVVLCHIRRNGWGGMGLKPIDALAFFGCDVCHEKEERHHPDCTDGDILRALGETILIQNQSGIFTMKGEDI